jgi:hypothetical protein
MIGPGSDVRAAKALPADMPRVIEHGIPVPDPVHPNIPFAVVATLLTEWQADVPLRDTVLRSPSPVSLAAYFFPSIFFRPPPALS